MSKDFWLGYLCDSNSARVPCKIFKAAVEAVATNVPPALHGKSLATLRKWTEKGLGGGRNPVPEEGNVISLVAPWQPTLGFGR